MMTHILNFFHINEGLERKILDEKALNGTLQIRHLWLKQPSFWAATTDIYNLEGLKTGLSVGWT